LRRLAADLPAELGAPVLIVLHVSATGGSVLASILDRASPLHAEAASEGEPLRAGRIYVAPPNCHLLVADGQARLDIGPRENGHRPAVDPLFRTAAETYGEHCCGVVLSGTRDDGTAGLAAIKARGGTTIVQDPEEAAYAGMPSSAMSRVAIDAVLPSDQIAAAVAHLVRHGRLPDGAVGHQPPEDPVPATERVTSLVCPECGGRIAEEVRDGVPVLSCHVGHVYGPDSFVAEQADATERALWTAIRALEDRRATLQRMAEQAIRRGRSRSAAHFARQAVDAGEQAQAVRATLGRFGEGLQRAPDVRGDETERTA
jgi:two-component system, chemotaxis family, protein-glutamate methylesterase/glutaminase